MLKEISLERIFWIHCDRENKRLLSNYMSHEMCVKQNCVFSTTL